MEGWHLWSCWFVLHVCLNSGIRVQGLGFRGVWSSGVEISEGLCLSLWGFGLQGFRHPVVTG